MRTPVLFAALGLAAAACVPAPLKPAGPHGVATHSWVVRPAPAVDPLPAAGERAVPVQAWYPSAAVEPGTVDSPRRGRPGAAPLTDDLPVVVFVHGSGSERRYHAALALHLASRGVVVVAADHTGVARKARFPDRRPVGLHPVFAELMAHGDLELAAADPRYGEVVALMESDVDAILAGLDGPLAGVGLDRVALGGHSLGATVALARCRARPECALWLNLDGPPLTDVEVGADGRADFVPAGLSRPALQVTTGGYLGVVPGAEAGWAAIDAQAALIDGPSLLVHLPAAGHLDLTDLPLLLPPSVVGRILGPGASTADDPAVPLVASTLLVAAAVDRHLRCDAAVDPAAVAEGLAGAELRHHHPGPTPGCAP